LNDRGFTLIELLLSVAILTLITGLSLPLYESFVRRNDLDLTTQSIAAAIRRAETYARGARGDSAWGIEIQASSIVLFKGTTFSTRDTGFDEAVTLPASVTSSGMSELTFSKLSGTPNTTGTLNLQSTTNTTRTITVNAEGMVDY
jgi:prepilin-type N-terminal cleavage/methylation domain-containing protein